MTKVSQAPLRAASRLTLQGPTVKNAVTPLVRLAILLVAAVVYSNALAAFPSHITAEWPETDFSIASVDPSEILSGGPPKDGIPAIDEPEFVDAEAASRWLHDDEPVIVVTQNGQTRAYPLQILIYHEIVNDTLGGRAIAVTFCPLCNSSIVFDRSVDGRLLSFGTTGKLRNSDLIMYDRQSESWWQQFTGEAIVGTMTGTELESLDSTILAFTDFRERWPEAGVLSRDTGFDRAYGTNPYFGYDSIDNSPFLFRGKTDERLKPMERVLALNGFETPVVLALTDLEPSFRLARLVIPETNLWLINTGDMASALDQRDIADSRTIAGYIVVDGDLEDRSLSFHIDQQGRLVDKQTGSVWDVTGRAIDGTLKDRRLVRRDKGVYFAFAWLAFRPESRVMHAGALELQSGY